MPNILVYDSGLGGLTVYDRIAAAHPDAQFSYVADDAVFPIGRMAPDALVARVLAVMERLIPERRADIVVIACNTASTLVMPPLRAKFQEPFVGTVPAVKPAAEQSKNGVFSVLATPGTVRRDYTHDLIIQFAPKSRVTLVGSENLARLGEAHLRGEPVSDEAIRAEIAPAFVDHDGKRTDTIVLACTHYPLLLDRFEKLAPWPVTWIDPAPAIARRVTQLIGEAASSARSGKNIAIFTKKPPEPALQQALIARGLTEFAVAEIA